MKKPGSLAGLRAQKVNDKAPLQINHALVKCELPGPDHHGVMTTPWAVLTLALSGSRWSGRSASRAPALKLPRGIQSRRGIGADCMKRAFCSSHAATSSGIRTAPRAHCRTVPSGLPRMRAKPRCVQCSASRHSRKRVGVMGLISATIRTTVLETSGGIYRAFPFRVSNKQALNDGCAIFALD